MLFPTRTNIPTLIARICAALPYMCVASEELPEGIRRVSASTLERGRLRLSMPPALLERLGELAPQRRGHLLRTTARVLVTLFAMARTDYVAGLLDNGRMALAPIDEQAGRMRTHRRLARWCGLDPDDPYAVRDVEIALQLLHATTLRRLQKTRRKKKSSKGKWIATPYLIKVSGAQRLRGAQIDDGAHRGGLWGLGQIHEDLFEGIKRKFLQLPAAVLEFGHRELLGAVAVLAQHAYKRHHKAGTMRVSEKVLMIETGSYQPSRAGPTRGRAYLSRIMSKLIDVGILVSASVDKGMRWILDLLEPGSLAPQPAGASEFGLESALEPGSLAREVEEAQGFRGLKDALLKLVTTAERGCEYDCHPLASRGDSHRKGKGSHAKAPPPKKEPG